MTLLLALLAITILQQVAGYGEPFTTPSQAVGHPVYQERANFHLINVVRIDPTAYKTIYMAGYSPTPGSILGSTYPAVAPVYAEPRLFASAYNHSLDMATYSPSCFQHQTCSNNESPFTRIGYFYSCTVGNQAESENIAAGYSDPLATSNQWLCDQTNGACAADGSGSDGHRADIMGGYASAGVGYAYTSTSTYKYYWTQDFGGPCTGQTNPIYSGTHLIIGGQIKFGALFYSTSLVPSNPMVIIAGSSQPLNRELGAIGNGGNYQFNMTKGSACRSYYFTFTSGSTTYRYPDTGCLVTYGEGSCVTSFDAGCSGGTTPPTVAPTASPAPTKAATATPAPTKAPTGAPTKAPTTAPGQPTPAPTTAPSKAPTGAPTKAPTAVPTAHSGDQYIYQNGALVNGWTIYDNKAADITNPYSLNGVACIKAIIEPTTSGNYFFWFQRASEADTWTSVVFSYISPAPLYVFWNTGGNNPAASIPAVSVWTTTSVSFSTIGTPANIGAVELTFYNPSSSASTTMYLNNVYLH